MKQIHILHIVNSYGGTTVYKNLFKSLDTLGIKQTIFVPLNSKNHNRINNHIINFSLKSSSIIYSTSRKWYHKLLYRAKINIIKKDILKHIDVSNVDLVHAHTLCLDGAVAYLLHNEFHIPYITAIRNTDINSYYKKLFWQRNFFKQILLNAKNIIFISPAYKKIVANGIIDAFTLNVIEEKLIVLPSGVDDYFLKRKTLKKDIHQPIRVIYSGTFTESKNIHSVIKAIDKLISMGYDFQFSAFGIGLNNRTNDTKYIEELRQMSLTRDWVKLENSVYQEELCEIFSNSDIFAMPSFKETFGLVYVEALSQGLPIVYTQGQGFDGFYKDGKIGYGVNPYDINDIADKLEQIIKNYQRIKNQINIMSFDPFCWNKIACKYKNIYQKNVLL